MVARRDRIPGVSVDAERNINEVTGGLDSRLRKLERKAGRAGIVSSDTAAKPGEFLNVEAPPTGLTIIFPEPALIQTRATAVLRLPVAYVETSGICLSFLQITTRGLRAFAPCAGACRSRKP